MEKPSILRFRDYQTCLSEFEQVILVQCPQCQQAAKSICLEPAITWRLSCLQCGYVRTASRRAQQRRSMPWWKQGWWEEWQRYRGAVDPLFGLPLWLQSPCCGAVLWAYNLDHLNFLEQYVRAPLRERQGGKGYHHSMAVRLPRWMKQAHHRHRILQEIKHLKAKALQE